MKVLIVIGSILIGYVIPEFFKKPGLSVPRGQNIFIAVGLGLISTGIVYG